MHGVNSGHVDSLHTNILNVIRSVTNGSFAIVSSSHRDAWVNQPAGVRITFELGTLPNHPEGVVSDYIDRDFGGRSFAFQVGDEPGEDPTVWAGWYEEWETTKAGLYNLIAISWTFYWGVYARRRPNILRADWDSLKYRNPRAAQPHWHIDPPFFAETFGRVIQPARVPSDAEHGLVELPPVIEAGLEELGPDIPQAHLLRMQGMHLGMGGWHHGREHPTCWRQPMPSGWREITAWVEKTLIYAQGQFDQEFSAIEFA